MCVGVFVCVCVFICVWVCACVYIPMWLFTFDVMKEGLRGILHFVSLLVWEDQISLSLCAVQ